MSVVLVFFFSSRRRHTRSLRDWSSDVCSSDLDHGFRVNRGIAVLDGVEEVIAQCEEWERRRGELDFEIDGAVVKVDDLELQRSEEHTSELQSRRDLVCRLLLEKKKNR